jgi:hypothetical protein
MPVPTEMTFSEAVTAVQAACGQLDDAVANPLFVQEIQAHLNRATRMLQRECQWLAQDRIFSQVLGNQRWVELPTDGLLGAVSEVRWTDSSWSGFRVIPKAGIDTRELLLGGFPLAYDISPTRGIVSATMTNQGTGYVDPVLTITGGARDPVGTDPTFTATVEAGNITAISVDSCGTGWTEAPTLVITDSAGVNAAYTLALGPIQALELWPYPLNGGTLDMLYRSQAYTMTEEDDILPFDSEAIIGKAALLTAVARALPIATALGSLHDQYMNKARAQQRPGTSMSMSAWRRDGWDWNQVSSVVSVIR